MYKVDPVVRLCGYSHSLCHWFCPQLVHLDGNTGVCYNICV